MTPAQLTGNAADLRVLAKKLRTLADHTESLLDATHTYDDAETWSGPYSQRASTQLATWHAGLLGTATAMRATADDWDSAATSLDGRARAATPPAKAGST